MQLQTLSQLTMHFDVTDAERIRRLSEEPETLGLVLFENAQFDSFFLAHAPLWQLGLLAHIKLLKSVKENGLMTCQVNDSMHLLIGKNRDPDNFTKS